MTTIHRARWPLSVVIPLLAAANFLLVLAICLALIGLPMGRGSDEVLLRPVSDRAAAIAGDIDSGLMLFPTEDWDQLLESESQRLGVTLALIEPNGRLVAGPQRWCLVHQRAGRRHADPGGLERRADRRLRRRRRQRRDRPQRQQRQLAAGPE